MRIIHCFYTESNSSKSQPTSFTTKLRIIKTLNSNLKLNFFNFLHQYKWQIGLHLGILFLFLKHNLWIGSKDFTQTFHPILLPFNCIEVCSSTLTTLCNQIQHRQVLVKSRPTKWVRGRKKLVVFFTITQSWQCWHYCQLCIPIYLQFSALFAPTVGSKCEIRNQGAHEDYISRFHPLLE